MEKSTLSQNWSRVNRLTPKLLPRVKIVRQTYRGQPWYVLHDPLSNQFFRLNVVSYHLVGLMDGRRSVDQVWTMTLDRYGDDAPTQDEVIGLLGQLHSSNLLDADVPVDAEPLLERGRKRTLQQVGGQAMSLLFMRIPLYNPDRELSWLLPLVRPLLSPVGFVLWAIWLLAAMWYFLPHMGGFLGDRHSVLEPSNWGWMIVLFLITKALHELGHGLMCKRFGGVVPQTGIMMLVLFPAPYVDATSSWNFPSKWHRLLVSSAGMMFELAIAAGAAIVWVHAEPDSTLRQVCYNLIFLASVTTFFFNANPLLRFDGYYILADLLEIPNLYERGTKQLQYLVQRWGFGLKSLPPISSSPREQVVLTLYGFGSLIYRVLVLFGIILFIAGQMFELGLALALWSFIAWVLVPLGKFIRYLTVSPSLMGQRKRALSFMGVTVGLLVIFVGLIPMPDHRRVTGVVESAVRSEVAVQSDGYITEVFAEKGRHIKAGQPVLKIENRELLSQRDELLAERQRLLVERAASIGDDAVQERMNAARLKAVDQQLATIHDQINQFTLYAPQDGVIVGQLSKNLVGQFVKRGTVVAGIADLSQLRVTALVNQADNAPLFEDQKIERVELRIAGMPERVIDSTVYRQFEAATLTLPHPALGYAGGGPIATDPRDGKGLMMTQPHFVLWLSLADAAGDAMTAPLPGQRVYVRLTLDKQTPLIAQWAHHLRKVLRDRLPI